jgi:hypothetical protein
MMPELGLVDADVNGRMKCVDYIGRLQGGWPIQVTERKETYISS